MTATLPNPTITNDWNQLLNDRRNALAGAQRYALTPDCNPITGEPVLTSAQRRAQLISVPINATLSGDNLLIPTLAGQKLIYELVIWNASAAAVSLAFYQGASAKGILLLPMSNFPATTGFTLGFNGNFEQPHFIVDNGQPFVLNTSTTGPVQGMIRYKIANGTSYMAFPAQTTLQTAVSSGVTTITPVSAAGLTAPCYLVIEQEIIFCPTALSGGSFTGVTRGVLSTTAAAHAQYVAVYGLFSDLFPFTSADGEFLNAIAAELATVETRITSAAAGNVTAVTGTAPIASSGGTTPNISVAAATSAALGVVRPDGTIITVTGGAITVPKASSSVFGVVEVDGVTILSTAGVISTAGAEILTAVLTLSNAQVITMFSAPTLIIPAPPPGSLIEVIRFSLENLNGGTPYVGGGNLSLFFGNTTSAASEAAQGLTATFLTAPTVTQIGTAQSGSLSLPASLAVGLPVYMGNLAQNFTQIGNAGTLRVVVTYRITTGW